jgi:hypothetical protein
VPTLRRASPYWLKGVGPLPGRGPGGLIRCLKPMSSVAQNEGRFRHLGRTAAVPVCSTAHPRSRLRIFYILLLDPAGAVPEPVNKASVRASQIPERLIGFSVRTELGTSFLPAQRRRRPPYQGGRFASFIAVADQSVPAQSKASSPNRTRSPLSGDFGLPLFRERYSQRQLVA